MSARNPFAGRSVKSRRGGTVKEPLSRDRIVDEALGLLVRNGLDGMSLRAVAAELETGAASLYVYVDGLDSLRALVLDRALERVSTPVTRRRRGWRARLKSVLECYIRVLMATPGLAQLALRTIASGPSSLRVIEALLDALEDGGLDPATAAWAVDLLLLYATAVGAEHSRPEAAKRMGPITRALSLVSREDFPRVYGAREELLSGKGEERFEWAVETLIAGVLHNRRGPRRTSSGR
jgi:AcrR family transcriptional regulator